jgi:hypothetical protein
MYYILYFINLPTGVFLYKKKYATKLVLSLKYQTLNMQATYESSISCFDGKLLWLTTNILKKVILMLVE